MATALERRVVDLFDRFDALDFDGMAGLFADDVQGVDEISRKWLRGKSRLTEYFAQLEEMGVSDVKSALSDFTTVEYGDVGVVTLIADQTYRVGGEHQAIHAPVTVLFRKLGADWKISLVHAVPLPEEG